MVLPMTDEERDAYMNEVQDPPMHWDRLGVGISLREWSDLMHDDNYRVVNQTLISARYLVSTVWLGIDYSFGFMGREGHPLQFETMVFDQGTGAPRDDLEQERYGSEAAAREGHERYVQLVMTLEGTDDRIDAKP